MSSGRLGLVQRLFIRRCVGSRLLSCGCTVGVYETYGGSTLNVIDEHALGCRQPEHASNGLLPGIPPDATAGERRL
jgi:hypothetical protein